MTAETLIATRAKAGFPVAGGGLAGALYVATGTYEIAAAVEAGDIFEMCKVPAGAVVVDGLVYGDDIDTGTEALDFDIGWKATALEATDTDGFGNLGTITGDATTDVKPEASIWYPFGGVLRTAGPKKFTAEATIQIYVNTASNAGHVGTITVVVYYFMDPNFAVTG
jgi:hypothetical protein